MSSYIPLAMRKRHGRIETIFAMKVDFQYIAMSVVEDDATCQ